VVYLAGLEHVPAERKISVWNTGVCASKVYKPHTNTAVLKRIGNKLF